jgi:MinD-like ATPase involved in chromosome partitioning or flagellar assembly/CheY-like chemotaxis protein
MIEDNPDYAELVQDWLSTSGPEFKFVLNWADSLNDGLRRLAAGGIDVVLLDLNLPDSSGIETFLAMRHGTEGIPVVVLSSEDDEPQALQLVREGAENYLVKSNCDGQLLTRALRYAVIKQAQATRARRDISVQQATVVGVIASKGGAGATTVACNLTAEIHRQAERSVLLVDVDLDGGLASFLSGLEPEYSLEDAIANLRGLDRTRWDSLVAHSPLEYDLISGPQTPADGEISANQLKDLLEAVRLWYDWIVLDLGRLNRFSTAIMSIVDELIVVTRTALPDLYQAKRAVEGLIGAGMDMERTRLVVNEAGRSKPFSTSQFKSIFGVDVYAVLPEACDELESAFLEKRLPSESGKIRREMASVARRLAGLPETQPTGILQSLSQRFRKPTGTHESAGTPAGCRGART